MNATILATFKKSSVIESLIKGRLPRPPLAAGPPLCGVNKKACFLMSHSVRFETVEPYSTGWWVSMVVRFVCVVCVPLCVRVFRVSRVCPGSPRCLFTGYPVTTWRALMMN